jgi:hypothetical protein
MRIDVTNQEEKIQEAFENHTHPGENYEVYQCSCEGVRIFWCTACDVTVLTQFMPWKLKKVTN